MIETSASQLGTFYKCNRKWYYKYREKLKTVLSIGQLVGLTTHSVNEHGYKLLLEDNFVMHNHDTQEFANFVNDNFMIHAKKEIKFKDSDIENSIDKIYETSPGQLLFGKKEDRKNLDKEDQKALIKAAKALIIEQTKIDALKACVVWRAQIYPHITPRKDKGVEVWREVMIPKYNVKLRGKIDLIDDCLCLRNDVKTRGVPIIRDLKVLNKTPSSIASDEQYIFYSLLEYTKNKWFPEIVQDTIIKLKSGFQYKTLSTHHDMRLIKTLLNRIKLFADCVSDPHYKFPCTDSNAWWCSEDWCDFYDVCRSEGFTY